IQWLGQSVAQLRPVGLQLLVQQCLCSWIIVNPHQAIPLLVIAQSFPRHLPGEPFPPVLPDLHVAGKPSLNPGIHPSHLRLDLVVVQHTTPPLPANDVLAPGAPTWDGCQTAQRTHGPAADLFLRSDPARQFLLIHRARTQGKSQAHSARGSASDKSVASARSLASRAARKACTESCSAKGTPPCHAPLTLPGPGPSDRSSGVAETREPLRGQR